MTLIEKIEDIFNKSYLDYNLLEVRGTKHPDIYVISVSINQIDEVFEYDDSNGEFFYLEFGEPDLEDLEDLEFTEESIQQISPLLVNFELICFGNIKNQPYEISYNLSEYF